MCAAFMLETCQSATRMNATNREHAGIARVSGPNHSMRQTWQLGSGAVTRLIPGYMRLGASHNGLPARLFAVRVFGSKAVLVVESPTKAKKIQQFLGSDYQVFASYGHVRDLPPRTGSVLPDQDFEMRWQLSYGAGPRLAEIEQALRTCGSSAAAGASKRPGGPLLVLATDPDREGEAISWHLLQELQRRRAIPSGGQVQRITFTEITKAAVEHALANPRQVSQELVNAYLARRALDYLVGFGISPVLWRRLPGARSAGRVQSVALRLVSVREDEIEAFTPLEYWSVDVQLRGPNGKLINASLVQVDGRKLHTLTGIPTQQDAEQLVARIQAAMFQVQGVDRKVVQQSPPPPFTTATLQQEASRKLGFAARRTMTAAQQLYEGAGTGEGLITYMRTDGLQLAGSAVSDIRATAVNDFGLEAVPDKPRFYKSRAKNAQEAHEAVRPTRASLRPTALSGTLTRDQFLLYELIWRRALACQMSNAVLDQVGANIVSMDGSLCLRATGSSVISPGYLQVYDRRYQAAADQDQEEEAAAGSQGEGQGASNAGSAAAALTKLQPGQQLGLASVTPLQHFTRPPPRYTDASLIKDLEQRGIGRPSTFTSILSVLQERGYVVKEGRSLHVSPLGRILSTFLQRYFPTYVDYGFTSNMEDQLDEVSGGRCEWRSLMHEFWVPFNNTVQDVMSSTTITDVYNMLDERLAHLWFNSSNQALLPQASSSASSSSLAPSAQSPSSSSSASLVDLRACPACGTGRLVLKPSKSGGFIGCSNFESTGCEYKRPLAQELVTVDEATGEVVRGRSDGAQLLGYHPENGLAVIVKQGPFGYYVELEGSEAMQAEMMGVALEGEGGAAPGEGEGGTEGEAGAEVEVEAVPKKRGRKRKDEGAAADGPQAGGATTTKTKPKKKAAKVAKPKPRRAVVPKNKAANLSLEEAVALLELPRFLGRHPEDGLPVLADSGRYGPYVTHASVFASLGKAHDPREILLDQAVELLDAKRHKLADQAARGILPRGRRGKGKAGTAVADKAAAPAKRGRAKKATGATEGSAGSFEAADKGRRSYSSTAVAAAEVGGEDGGDGGQVQAVKRRGRPRKQPALQGGESDAESQAAGSVDGGAGQEAGEEVAPAKRRGRSRALPAPDAGEGEGTGEGGPQRIGGEAAQLAERQEGGGEAAPAKRRGRPKKVVPQVEAQQGRVHEGEGWGEHAAEGVPAELAGQGGGGVAPGGAEEDAGSDGTGDEPLAQRKLRPRHKQKGSE